MPLFSCYLYFKGELTDQLQSSNNIENGTNGKKIEFTSFARNNTCASNNTNSTIITTDHYQHPFDRSISGNSCQNIPDLNTPDNLDSHLENGKAPKEYMEETIIIQSNAPSVGIGTSAVESSLEERFVIKKN